MVSMTEAFTAGRAERRVRRREAVIPRVAKFLGRRLPTWRAAKSFVLQVSGLACVDLAAFQWTLTAGLVVTGVSLFVLEWLVGGDS